jgi:antitoxin VapB
MQAHRRCLNIKNERVADVTRALAAATGESMTSAVEAAAREKLERMQAEGRHEPAHLVERRARIGRSVREMQRIAKNSGMTREQIDEDMWDDWGLPR